MPARQPGSETRAVLGESGLVGSFLYFSESKTYFVIKSIKNNYDVHIWSQNVLWSFYGYHYDPILNLIDGLKL